MGRTGDTLIDLLMAPLKMSPHSLEGQLQYLLERWGPVLAPEVRQLIVRAMDLMREETVRAAIRPSFPASAPVPDYSGEPEDERYSSDLDWMPRVVLLAKNSYVWLEQLSRKYKRWIRTLEEIPDEELDALAARGFTALWLIGLWERSPASQCIKQRMGNADAVASAYAVRAYDIAPDLGGWSGLRNLGDRAGKRGIRLSADMVPNHMGIDSRWVIEHPDWFLAIDDRPFPSYSFNSENVSDDPRIAMVLEDHYYDRSDAAVVFERRDLQTGDRRYVYHGNDGTGLPWNDTAQLDYTKAEVREAVIQTILHVARNFPIIRFDSAMTLAKKHFQRLWFPQPGRAGAIASRAEHGMTWRQFNDVMPREFWREVVDRVAAEVPETLLLAEAFWLLEGYFVRTLGMHRVYNSAFMHMLRDEQNAKYRELIKNTLSFDPQILKRYVNFMSNPDEKTAIQQFGNGDKYFGVCTLLVTLPGLPMFAHGQIEGLREKYGMDFRRPRLDEAADEALIRGHEWKIFPLLRRRELFADVEQFSLFDFYAANGKVNEDVIAYSNRRGEDRALVLFNNRQGGAAGWIRTSTAALDKRTGLTMQRSLAEALVLPETGCAIVTDYVSHLEFIRPCAELWEKGLFADLEGFQHHVLLDWRFVEGAEWNQVAAVLGGQGVESVQRMLEQLRGAAAAGPPVRPKTAATGKWRGKVPAKTAGRRRAAAKNAKSTARAAATKPAPSNRLPKKPPAVRKLPAKATSTKAGQSKQSPKKSTNKRIPEKNVARKATVKTKAKAKRPAKKAVTRTQ